MRIFLPLLLVVHGLLHLPGFLKTWQLATLPQLNSPTLIPLGPGPGRIFGLLWLITALLCGITAALHLARSQAWPTVGLVAVLLSQILIILWWRDARAGSVANVLLLAAIVPTLAMAHFVRSADQEAHQLLAPVAAAPAAPTVVTAAELASLPPPVQAWLSAAGIVGRSRAASVRLQQSGGLRTSPTQAFSDAQAIQYFTVDPPGFVWRVELTMMGLPIVGRDKYADGHGSMRIVLAGLLPIVDASGEQIDQGTLLRYLGELVWFPSAALHPQIRWEPVDAHSARATFTHRGVQASAVFSFDDRGRFVGMTAQRFMGGGADAKQHPWVVSASEWQTFDGIQVPSRGEVTWKLPDGDFTYYRWQLSDLAINQPQLYPSGR